MRRTPFVLGIAIALTTLSIYAHGMAGSSSMSHPPSPPSPGRVGTPPTPGGYFHLQPPTVWAKLPGDVRCAARIHRSSWEPRPENAAENHHMPTLLAVHRSLASRRRALGGSVDRRWDSWLLPRVNGHFTGTTDEIMQWAACKWGLPDDLLRAIAVRESTWYEYLHFTNGSCYVNYGCGDIALAASPATRTYCTMLAKFGYDYQRQFRDGICPETFSIAGVKSWEDPSWGRYPGNQNGTFPFNRNSTAFALDYLGGELRGCFQGWQRYLAEGHTGYSAGQIWGCVGAWYAGDWHSSAANGYIAAVRATWSHHTWLQRSFRQRQYQCSPVKGCPR